MRGTLYGIGVGPGDPELLTVKAVNILQRVPWIAAPQAAATGSGLALSIVRPYLAADRRILELPLPMTADPVRLAASWQHAAGLIMDHLARGEDVALITLGDPTLYSTYLYLHQFIAQQGYAAQIIPGVPAMCAVAARTGVGLAVNQETLAVVPATGILASQLAAILEWADNVVLLKPSMANLGAIEQLLMERNLVRRTVMVNRCGQPEERIHQGFDSKILAGWDYFTTILIKNSGGTP